MAPVDVSLLLSALRLATVLLGLTFLAVVGRTYHRKRSWAILSLGIAGLFLTAAAAFAWWTTEILGWASDAVSLGEAGLLLLGFVWLVYSLIVPDEPDRL